MAAFPITEIGRSSRADPDAGILTDQSDDLVIKQRRNAAGTRYRISLLLEWITLSQYDTLLTAFDTSLGPYEFDLHGQSYTARFTNEPAIVERSGALVRVQCDMIGTRV